MAAVKFTAKTGVKLLGNEALASLVDNTPGVVGCDADQVTRLETNGDFTSDISGWADGSDAGGSIAWNASGYIDLINSTGTARAKSSFTTVIGRTYRLTIDKISGNSLAFLGTVASGSDVYVGPNDAVDLESAFTAKSTTTHITIVNNVAATTAQITSISIIEYCAPNLLSYPEQFVNAVWSINDVVIEDNIELAPNGSRSADKITGLGNVNFPRVQQTNIPVSTGTDTVTHSIYVKDAGNGEITLNMLNSTTAESIAVRFVFTNGVPGPGSKVAGGAALIATTQAEIINGWYRLSVTNAFVTAFTSTDTFLVSPHLTWNTPSTGGMYIWGTQLTETTELQGYGSSHDLSPNDLALEVKGQLTKSPVNTGCELQAWSGFSVNDYLEQAYNPALDFGTSDFIVRGWVKLSNTEPVQVIYERGDVANTTALRVYVTGGNLYFNTRASGVNSQVIAPINSNEIFQFVGVRRNAGTILDLYINSSLIISQTVTARNITINTSSIIGGSLVDPAWYLRGNACLIMAGSGALSPLQIQAIYNQEKELFKEYENLTVEGVEYDLDLILNQYDQSDRPIAHPVIAIGGNQETTFERRDVFHNFTIINKQRENLSAIKNFFRSVEKGESFTFDPYGTTDNPDTQSIVKADPGYRPKRNGTNDEFTISMKVREV